MRLLGGSGLEAVNNAVQGLSDPFCQIYVRRTRQMRVSEKNSNTVDPRWHQSFFFENVRSDDILDVYCWDHNLAHADFPLGSLSIPVSHALSFTQKALHSFPPPPTVPLSAGNVTNSTTDFGGDGVSPVNGACQPPAHPASSLEASLPHLPEPAVDAEGDPGRRRSYSELTMTNTFYTVQPSAPTLEELEAGPCPGSTSTYAPFASQPVEPPESYVPPSQPPACVFHGPPAPPPPDMPSTFSSMKPALSGALREARNTKEAKSLASQIYHVAPRMEMSYSSMRMDFDESRIAAMQHSLSLISRPYALSTKGQLWFAVVDSKFPNVNEELHRNKFKMFVTFKYSDKVRSEVVSKPLKMLGKFAFAKAAAAAKPVTDKVKPLHHVGKEFPTWKIDMLYVYQVFGAKRQGWNREYEAARKIFESSTLRGVVKAQHAMLYGATGLAGTTNVRHSLMAETGAISGGMEFVQLLRMGIRSGKTRMFTYVLQPDRLYIAETGADFFLDLNSKHAVRQTKLSLVPLKPVQRHCTSIPAAVN